MLTRDTILGAHDFETRTVDVPEWGGEVMVRSLSGAARDRIESVFLGGETNGLKALVVILTACEADGSLLFTDDDLEPLRAKSAVAIERVFDAAWELSGLAPDAVEDAEGN